MHQLRVVDERMVDQRPVNSVFFIVQLDNSISTDIITSFAAIISYRFFLWGWWWVGGVQALLKKKRSILSYFFVAKSVSNTKSNDTYRHFIICDRGSISVKLLPINVQVFNTRLMTRVQD